MIHKLTLVLKREPTRLRRSHRGKLNQSAARPASARADKIEVADLKITARLPADLGGQVVKVRHCADRPDLVNMGSHTEGLVAGHLRERAHPANVVAGTSRGSRRAISRLSKILRASSRGGLASQVAIGGADG